jgi:branched-chain amino acid transport system substrate-binding protein
MSAVLAAIRAAGARGNDRQRVIEEFFAIRNRASVLGRYSVTPSGDTTLGRFAVDRVVGGKAVFSHALDLAGAPDVPVG